MYDLVVVEMWSKVVTWLLIFMSNLSAGGVLGDHGPCRYDSHCTASQFCQPLYYAADAGRCEECWKCCNYPEYFDPVCINKCRCAMDGTLCSNFWECSNDGGMFCDKQAACRLCSKDCMTGDEGCVGACRNVSVGRDDSLERRRAWFYKRMLLETGEMNEPTDEDTPLITRAARVCPQLAPRAPNITLGGCPCALYSDSMVLRCPKGTVCSAREPLVATLEDMLLMGNNVKLDGYCRACVEGELCDVDGLVGQPPPCPAGYFCTNATHKQPCPAGSFCVLGSTRPLTCEMKQLALRDIKLNGPGQSALERLLINQDPFHGNYCPPNDSSIHIPNSVCPPGHYCPNSSVIVICPAGHFCRQQSVAPVACPPLTPCTKGTTAPVFSYAIVVFYMALLGVLCLYLWRRKRAQHPPCISETTTGPPGVPKMYSCLIKPVKSIEFSNITAHPYESAAHPWLWPNSGEFKVGRLNAVMGSSGCGKSTLIEMLRGRVLSGVIEGSVSVCDGDGHLLCFEASRLYKPSKDLAQIRKLIGFVPQDDILLGELTVWENLLFSCTLKLPRFQSKSAHVSRIVGGVCKALGFDSKLQNRIVGSVEKRGISGGQRKRVSIGMEMVGLHPIIMMDEPTSGLDATAAQTLLQFAKDLTITMGTTIISVVHQPRFTSFMLFDQVVMLSRYGAVFCGSPTEAIAYYEKCLLAHVNINDNPADAIMDILTYGFKDADRVIMQQDQNMLWKQDGAKWLDELRRRYPLFEGMMGCSLAYDAALETTLDQKISADLNVANVIRFFESFGVKGVTVVEATVFCRRWGGDNKQVSIKELKLAFKSVCDAVTMRGQYDNMLHRIDLFSDLPASIHLCRVVDTTKQARIAMFVCIFAYRLMARCGIQRRAEGAVHGVLETKIIMAALNMKAAVLEEEKLINSCALQAEEAQISVVGSMNVFWQSAVLARRKLVSLERSPWFIQLLIPSLAAIIVGLIHGSTWSVNSFPSNITMAMACVGVLSMVTHVRTFSLEKAFIRRELANNVSLTGYFFAYCSVDMLWILSLPLMFFIPYYYLTFPLTNFIHFYIEGILVCWWSSGVAYVLSASPLALQWVNLIGVFIAIIFGAFINGLNPTIADASGRPGLQFLLGLSYNRWSMEYLSLQELSTREESMPNVVFAVSKKIGLCEMDQYGPENTSTPSNVIALLRMLGLLDREGDAGMLQHCNKYLAIDQVVLLFEGIVFRLLAFVMMWCAYDTIMQRLFCRIKADFYRLTKR